MASFSLLVFLLVFSGFGPMTGSCEKVLVSRPHVGFEASYAASGQAMLRSVIRDPIVDWSAVGSENQDGMVNEMLTFPKGSKLRIHSNDEPIATFDEAGRTGPAYGVDYVAKRANLPQELRFASVFLNATDGSPAQVHLRSLASHVENTTWQHHYTMRSNRPDLLLSHWFWNTTFFPGTRGHASFENVGLIPPSPDVEPATAEISFVVGRLAVRDGRCVAAVSFTLRGLSPGTTHVEATYVDGLPLPISYSEAERTAESQKTFHAQLVSFTDGTGNALPTYVHEAMLSRPPDLQTVNEVSRFDNPPAFSTSLAEAWGQVAPGDTSNRTADAPPLLVTAIHSIGSNGSGVRDAWRLQWISDNGSLSTGKFVKGSDGQSSWDVTDVDPSHESPISNLEFPWVPLHEMMNSYERLRGEQPEVLHCKFSYRICGLGTHDETGLSKEGEGGAGLVHMGLIFWIDNGLILYNDVRAPY